MEEERNVLSERDDRSKPPQHPSLHRQKSILPSMVSQCRLTVYIDLHHKPPEKSLEFLKPISFNFKKVNGSGQGNYASRAPRLWSPRSFNKTKFFFFCFFNLVFDQRNLYVTLFTKKKGFDEFGVRCWDLELDWWVLVSFLCWVGKDCGALGYSGYWIWSSCWLQLPRNSSSNINEDIQPCKSEFTIR